MNNYVELGTLGIISIFAVKEFFSYLKSRKMTNSINGQKEVLEELKLLNSNHLHSIENAINSGNDRIIDAINNGNQKVIELLGRIDGKLSR